LFQTETLKTRLCIASVFNPLKCRRIAELLLSILTEDYGIYQLTEMMPQRFQTEVRAASREFCCLAGLLEVGLPDLAKAGEWSVIVS